RRWLVPAGMLTRLWANSDAFPPGITDPGYNAALILRVENDQQHDQDRQNKESDLDPAFRIFATNRAGDSVGDDAISGAAVLIGQQPDRQEHVLECLRAVISRYFQRPI